MNAQVRYLQKQNERLATQVHFLLDVVDRMAADHEFLGSIACGFAWDMNSGWNAGDEEGIYVWEASARRAEEVP